MLAAHGPTVWALCRRLSPDPEDAYQDVWERIIDRLDHFEPARGTLRSWVLTVAHRRLVDRHRRRGVRGETVAPVDIPSHLPGAHELAERRQAQQHLERALANLPALQRRAVVLHHIHGMPLDRIAEVEGVPVGTIKSRLHRGRAPARPPALEVDMSHEDAINRLIDGELSPEEEAELRAAIADDPELARLAAAMQALPDQLAALPDALPDPPALRPGHAHTTSGFAPRWAWVAVAGLAAALAVAVGPLAFAPGPAHLQMEHGAQTIEGVSSVHIGSLRVDVAGEARISVEPATADGRSAEQEDPMKPHLPSAIGGVAAGALVTVAVVQGTALVYPAEGVSPVEVQAGQVHRQAVEGDVGPQPVRRVVRAPSAAAAVAPEQVKHAAPEVSAYIGALEEELEAARVKNAVLEGQLAARDGTPVDWPTNLPDGLTSDRFEATFQAVAGDVDGLTLDRVDCSEYPCIAVFQGDMEPDAVRHAAEAAQQSLENRVGLEEGEELSSRIAISQREDDDGTSELAIVLAPTVETDEDQGDLELRVNNRMQEALHE